MPELPEIQALSERVRDTFQGGNLTGIDLLQFSALKTFDPQPGAVRGKVLEDTARRGKFLILHFAEHRILVHFSQGGRAEFEEPPKQTRPKGAVGRLTFEERALLLKEYGTERKAGVWILRSDDDGPLAKLGPEPASKEFARLIRSGDDSRRLHTILRDQRTVAGIGRGYTDDLLHEAMLSPFATLKALTPDERSRLLEAVRETLEKGLAIERQRQGGLPPKLGDHWVVHKRHTEPCPRCSSPLRRVSFESYEITYCPACQTGGKILADRRLSRLIK